MVSELMVVCGEGGEVFMVPTQRGQRKPKRPTHKDPGEDPWTYGVPMDVRAGLTRGSHGWRTRDPWMTR